MMDCIRRHLSWRHLRFLLTIAAALGGVTIVLVGLAMADTPGEATPKTLDRDLEPVIVTGAKVPALLGSPVDQLFVYTYTAGMWTQIPAQVDEVTAAGDYTTTEDSVLDANDEIVLMAMDLGDQAPAGEFITSTLAISDTWYEIEVTNPLDPSDRGWAYLVRSSVITPAFTADYVDYDLGNHLIQGTTYSLHLAIPHPYFDGLTLYGSENILDRSKVRLCLAGEDSCWFNETSECLSGLEDNLIKDGPVRVIVRGGKGLAYHSVVYWTSSVSIAKLGKLIRYIRFSIDFNEQASRARYYNAVTTGEVIVDGNPEVMPEEPVSSWVSSWFQLSTASGSLIYVMDTSSMGGTQHNYYKDECWYQENDTGDHYRYADNGVSVQNPSEDFTYAFTLYVLPGSQPNLGATYDAYSRHPLLTKGFLWGRQMRIYLPLVMKHAS